MDLMLVNAIIVILGKDYAPGVLNPDFLKVNNIIPKKGWDVAETPITTPLFSIVKYKRGVTFTVEINKLQIALDYSAVGSAKVELPKIASKFIQNIGNTLHTAVGINITGLIEFLDYETFIAEKVISSGGWKSENLTNALVRLRYSLGDITLNLTLDNGTVTLLENNSERSGILVNANYHIDIPSGLSSEATSKKVEEAVSRFSEHHTHFKETVTSIFNLEG